MAAFVLNYNHLLCEDMRDGVHTFMQKLIEN